jgi:hypothetical protein
MPAVFEKLGMRFLYPDNWTLDESEAGAEDRTISVYSPEGAFWSIVLHPPSVEPVELAAIALKALQQEYAESEAEPADETIAGQRLTGYDLSFYYVDLSNTAVIRGFRNEVATGLILCQAEDRDFRRLELIFSAITTSLLEGYRAGSAM